MSTRRPNDGDDDDDEPLLKSFQRAVSLVESNPTDACRLLARLQERIAAAALWSSNNEVLLEDVGTHVLPLLATPHHWAVGLTRLPAKPGKLSQRLSDLLRSVDLWTQFFQTLQQMEFVASPHEQKQIDNLLELSDETSREDDDSDDRPNTMFLEPLATNRDAKIARFQAKRQAEQEEARLISLRERRTRLGMQSVEEMDGHDEESLEREIGLKRLAIAKQDAIEEWANVLREIPLLSRMVKQQELEESQNQRYGGNKRLDRPPDPRNRPGLQVTHITKSATGQLLMKKEEVRSEVFRRGWSQPTMSLEELAEKEVAEAMAREERQKESEALQKDAPRRYDQLVKDGMEDRADLVDASAVLDRRWDDFKDENPRGSGNKRSERGDRNF